MGRRTPGMAYRVQCDEHETLGLEFRSSSRRRGPHLSAPLDEDLNVAGAWGAIFDWIRDTNRHLTENSMDSSSAASALATWNRLDSVFGVGAPLEVEVPVEINALLEARQAARKSKDFK